MKTSDIMLLGGVVAALGAGFVFFRRASGEAAARKKALAYITKNPNVLNAWITKTAHVPGFWVFLIQVTSIDGQADFSWPVKVGKETGEVVA